MTKVFAREFFALLFVLACQKTETQQVVVPQNRVEMLPHTTLGVPPPLAPTDISVSVKCRRCTDFEVCWTNPPKSRTHQKVVAFDVAYARQPITAKNWDDPNVTGHAPMDHGPTGPGRRDCQVVKTLNIETDYYFGVRSVGNGKDVDGDDRS